MSLQTKEIYEFEGFRLDPGQRTLSRDGAEIPLTPKVFETLLYMVRNPKRVLTKDELLKEIWPDAFVEEVNLAVNISTLRKVLGEDPQDRRCIVTVTGKGYRFVAAVARPKESEDASGLEGINSDSGQVGALTAEEAGAALRSSNIAALPRLSTGFVLGFLVVLLLAGFGAYLFQKHKATKRPAVVFGNSIAILPFIDLSPNKDQEYFSDGLSEELINELGKVPGLKVVPRSSTFQFRGRNQDVRQVGKSLGVANVLEGSVSREGNRIRVTAELTKVSEGFQLWSETYDRRIDDIFAVQDEISKAVTSALQMRLLSPSEPAESSNPKTTSPEAYEAFLQSQYFFRRGEAKPDLERAIAYNDQAIKLDANYAPIWALRSAILTTMSSLGLRDHTSGYAEARRAAERGIALDPSLAANYVSLGWVQLSYEWDWAGAETSLKKATELEPSNLTALSYRAYLYECRGQIDEAIALTEQARPLDPERANLYLGDLLYLAGRYGEATDALNTALSINPKLEGAHANIAQILLSRRQPEAALAEIAKEPGEWELLTAKAMAYADLGRTADSDAALAKLIATHRNDSPYQIAEIQAYRGERDKAFEWLENAYRSHDPGLNQIKSDPRLQSLRSDPRYTALLARMHLN